jgi:hypothetical protein
MWKEDDLKFEAELVQFNNGWNIFIFQLVPRDKQIYVIGVYIPSNCTRRIEDLRRAGETCPAGCKLLVMGDLNLNVRFPRDKCEEVIVNLLNETNLVNTSCRFWLQTPSWTATRAQWTWSQKWGTTQYYSQPDYILAHMTERGIFKGVGFRFLRFPHLDHHTIIAVVRAGWGGGLRQYRCKLQKFPLSLPPGPKDVDIMAFNTLAAKCIKPKPKRVPGKDWISKGTWRLIVKQASLLQSSRIWQDAAQRMKRKIGTAIKADMRKLTLEVGDSIIAGLAKEDIKEAFWHLKGWYRKVVEMQARPCHQTMEHQTNKWEKLYAERAA